MRFYLTAILCVLLLSCNKTEKPILIDLHNTSWGLLYKYDGFSFYAQTELRFHNDTTFENIGVSDTVYGTWSNENGNIKLYFDNLAVFSGTAVSADSLRGTMFNAGTDGVWGAKKR
jgi:hypothetical protein